MQSDVAVLLKPIPVQDVIGKSTSQHEKQTQADSIDLAPEQKKQTKRDFSAFCDCI